MSRELPRGGRYDDPVLALVAKELAATAAGASAARGTNAPSGQRRACRRGDVRPPPSGFAFDDCPQTATITDVPGLYRTYYDYTIYISGTQLEEELGYQYQQILLDIVVPWHIVGNPDEAHPDEALAIFVHGSNTTNCPVPGPPVAAYQQFREQLVDLASVGMIGASIRAIGANQELRADLFRYGYDVLVEWLTGFNVGIRPRGLGIVGHSAGGGAAMLAASRFPPSRLGAVVALAPASVDGPAADPDGTEPVIQVADGVDLLTLVGTHDTETAMNGISSHDHARSDGFRCLFALPGLEHQRLGPAPNGEEEGAFFDETLVTFAEGSHLVRRTTVTFLQWRVGADPIWRERWEQLLFSGTSTFGHLPSGTRPRFRPPLSAGGLAPGSCVPVHEVASPWGATVPAQPGLPAGAESLGPAIIWTAFGRASDPALASAPAVMLPPSCLGDAQQPAGERHEAHRTFAIRIEWNLVDADPPAALRIDFAPFAAASIPWGPHLDHIYVLLDLALVVNADLNLENQVLDGLDPEQPVFAVEPWRPRVRLVAGLAVGSWVAGTALSDHHGLQCALPGESGDLRRTVFGTLSVPMTALAADLGAAPAVTAIDVRFDETSRPRGSALLGPCYLAWRLTAP